MMLKRISTFCTPNSIPFLTTGISSASRVISRALSDQDIEVVGKWDLLSAVCLERHPIITKPLQDMETRYQSMLQRIEHENSVYSDFEIRKRKEEKQKREQSNQTIQDFQDLWEEELTKFKFAPRTSEIGEDNTVVSIKRKLDKNLILLVEQKIGNSNFLIPPQCIRQQRETMIEAASRSLKELCGDNIRVRFYGNAPIGFYQYKYPTNLQKEGRDGAKIFYFLAKYISGNVSLNAKHCWLDREELKATTHPDVHKCLSKFLLPE